MAELFFSSSWRILEPGGPGREGGAEMHESRLIGGVRQALVVVGAVFGVALLSAGLASAADPVQLKSRLGNWCLDGPNGNNTATMVNPCNGSSIPACTHKGRRLSAETHHRAARFPRCGCTRPRTGIIEQA
jgi:hypothetical protein